jgi:hypothetical protein
MADGEHDHMHDNERPLKRVKLENNDPVSRIAELGFNNAERFVQGERLSSMAEAYAQSTPYFTTRHT